MIDIAKTIGLRGFCRPVLTAIIGIFCAGLGCATQCASAAANEPIAVAVTSGRIFVGKIRVNRFTMR